MAIWQAGGDWEVLKVLKGHKVCERERGQEGGPAPWGRAAWTGVEGWWFMEKAHPSYQPGW